VTLFLIYIQYNNSHQEQKRLAKLKKKDEISNEVVQNVNDNKNVPSSNVTIDIEDENDFEYDSEPSLRKDPFILFSL
jgi:hypothetical protein